MRNVLQQSIYNGELHKFLAGEAPYFYDTKTDNLEPQNVGPAFEQLVIAEWKNNKTVELTKLDESLSDMLNIDDDKNKAIYVAMDWLWNFYSHAAKQTTKDEFLRQKFSQTALILKRYITDRKSELRSDIRWAGAKWNSDSGLYQPILDMANDIENRLNGPKLLK